MDSSFSGHTIVWDQYTFGTSSNFLFDQSNGNEDIWTSNYFTTIGIKLLDL